MILPANKTPKFRRRMARGGHDKKTASLRDKKALRPSGELSSKNTIYLLVFPAASFFHVKATKNMANTQQTPQVI